MYIYSRVQYISTWSFTDNFLSATITTTHSKLLTLTYVNPLTHKKYPTILCYHLARIQTSQNKRQNFNLHIYMSKVTAPKDGHEQFSAAGFPWLKHFPGYELIKQNKKKTTFNVHIYQSSVYFICFRI